MAPVLTHSPDATVLVVAGMEPSVALYATDAAIALGAVRVDFLSANQELLSIAARLGANPLESAFEGVRGPYSLTVDASCDPAGLRLALRSTEREGVCVCAAYYPFDETPVPLCHMYTKGVVFHTGRCHARTVIPAVARAMADGRLHPQIVTTRRVRWEEAAEAMAEPAAKLVIDREPVHVIQQ